jgi:hypothetical protein
MESGFSRKFCTSAHVGGQNLLTSGIWHTLGDACLLSGQRDRSTEDPKIVEGSHENDESACCVGFAEWMSSDRDRDDRWGSHSDCSFHAAVPLLSTLWYLRHACSQPLHPKTHRLALCRTARLPARLCAQALLRGLNLRSENLCGAPDAFSPAVGTGDTTSVADRSGSWPCHWWPIGRACHGSLGDTDMQNDDSREQSWRSQQSRLDRCRSLE